MNGCSVSKGSRGCQSIGGVRVKKTKERKGSTLGRTLETQLSKRGGKDGIYLELP